MRQREESKQSAAYLRDWNGIQAATTEALLALDYCIVVGMMDGDPRAAQVRIQVPVPPTAEHVSE